MGQIQMTFVVISGFIGMGIVGLYMWKTPKLRPIVGFIFLLYACPLMAVVIQRLVV
jgi:hypothetical protein